MVILQEQSVRLLGLGSALQAALFNTIINTKYGPVQGIPAFNSSPAGNITNWQDITVWRGIPFAASTAGSNRWRPPQPRTPWNGTLVADQFGAACPSSTSDSGYTFSEDCLNLNIWTAGLSTDERRPVVLWSYPAGGTNSKPLFDGGGMASKGVVFVNYNYRTGALGWLAHPELSGERLQENGHNSSGNYGMLDQFAALRWVHENIASFGGDPNRITVMGQSAGSAAVYHMVNSPLCKGLIVGAIAESGTRDVFDPMDATLAENYANLSTNLPQGVAYVKSLNVSTIAQMRGLPLSAFGSEQAFPHPPGGGGGGGGGGGAGGGGGSNSTTTFSFSATLDYYAMPNTYLYTVTHGPANDVPYITGNTKDESGATSPAQTNVTVAQYMASLQSQFGAAFASKFLALYPAANNSEASMAYNARYRDLSRVSSWLFANRWQTAAKSPIYTYYWDHAPPGQNGGAGHMSEINYVLNNLYGTALPWQALDFAIADQMSAYWANFAKTGDPNRGDSYQSNSNATLPSWTRSTPSSNETMRVGDGFGPVPVAKPAQVGLIVDFFSSQPPF